MPERTPAWVGHPGEPIAGVAVQLAWGDDDELHVWVERSVGGGMYLTTAHFTCSSDEVFPPTSQELERAVDLQVQMLVGAYRQCQERASRGERPR